MEKKPPVYGIVLSGGGARGAYEAGVIHYIRSALSPPARTLPFQLYCGSSVGAINTCFLASMAETPEAQGIHLRKTWEALRQDNIYRRDTLALGKLLVTSFAGLTANIFRKPKAEGEAHGIHFRGLVDTSPLPRFLRRMIQWNRLNENVERGLVHGVSVTLTNMRTGNLEFFIHKHAEVSYYGLYPVRFCPIQWQHVMASAAIPILFPPVKVDDTYYADGGLRLNTPMSPAIHMGADRVLVIGNHDPSEAADAPIRDERTPQTPPTLGEIIGKILSSIFLDRLDYDLKQMDRINQIIAWSEQVYGADYLDRLNAMLSQRGITGDIASRGLKRLAVLSISPTRDLREIFSEVLKRPSSQKYFSSFEKTLLKLLDVDMHRGEEFLSYFLFLPEYLRALTALGFDDAQARHDDLMAFLSP
ncbi:MAG: patatin-like phospholipase family protein [Deltaproteobacteria bacterium]|nr:patatin-like phospholipase family protein [Deltaproteobacteria bacterium]